MTVGGRRAQIWSTSSDSLLGVLSDPGVAPLVTVAFSRDHHQIVGIDENGNIQIWSAWSDTLLGAISVPPTVGLNGAGFSPDGQNDRDRRLRRHRAHLEHCEPPTDWRTIRTRQQ